MQVQLGDPSGRATERRHEAAAAYADNERRVATQLDALLRATVTPRGDASNETPVDTAPDRGSRRAETQFWGAVPEGEAGVISNRAWLDGLSAVEFFASVGRNTRVSAMLGRDSVRSRLESEDGLNLAEFCYQCFQAYDFWELHRTRGVSGQIGGSDQWGNIVAGLDLIRKLSPDASPSPFALTVPLLTTPAGEKMGKSAGNAVWLDASLTAPYDLYQYWMNVADDHVGHLLRALTFLPLSVLDGILTAHGRRPERRWAQRALATEVVRWVHGAAAAAAAVETRRAVEAGDSTEASGMRQVRAPARWRGGAASTRGE